VKGIAAQLSIIGAQLIKPILDPQLKRGRETDLVFWKLKWAEKKLQKARMHLIVSRLEDDWFSVKSEM